MPIGLPDPSGIRLPPSPLNPVKDFIREGSGQIKKARNDLRSLAQEMSDLSGKVAGEPARGDESQKEALTSESDTASSTDEIKKGTACLPCVLPSTMILVNPGAKLVTEVSDGDKVIDARGKLSTVKKVMKRFYNGDLISVTVPYQNQPIVLTPEHPVLAIRCHSCRALRHGICLPGKDNPRCRECQFRYDYKPEFIAADQLSASGIKKRWVKHALIMPRVSEIKDIDILDITYLFDIGYEEVSENFIKPMKKNAHNRSRTAVQVKRYVPVDAQFMKLAGFYLSEGSVTFQKRGAMLRFDFGYKETNYAEEVLNLIMNVFGVKAKIIKSTSSTIRVQALSSILGHLFANLLGKGSTEKRIPYWMLILPKEKEIPLLEGYWRGDGYSRREKRIRNSMNFQAHTVSARLAYTLRIILHRLGIIHNLSKLKKRSSYIQGRKVNVHVPYCISIGGPSAIRFAGMIGYETCPWIFLQSHLVGIDNKWIYLPIKEIERKPYSGLVYNMATEPSQTYTANGVVVHNCSRDHLSTSSSALSEGIRFAREKGVKNVEVVRRLRIAIDELNIMERIDLAPSEIVQLKGKEKETANWVLGKSRELRHDITAIKNADDMERVAAKAADVTELFMSRLFDLPEDEEGHEGEEVKESLKDYLKSRGKTKEAKWI